MPGPRLSRKRSSAVQLRAAYMRPLRGVSLLGETIYSNQPKMRQCLCKAVCGNVVGDIIRGGLGGIAGVAHGDAEADARLAAEGHQALLAELDLRFHPIDALLAALRSS